MEFNLILQEAPASIGGSTFTFNEYGLKVQKIYASYSTAALVKMTSTISFGHFNILYF